MTLQTWATNFPECKAEHFVFPWEHYGFAGNERKVHAKTMTPNVPVGDIKTAWDDKDGRLRANRAPDSTPHS